MVSITQIHSREIWLVSLNDAEGHEQRGTRPALVIATHRQANVCMVIPLTGNQDTTRFPYTHSITANAGNGLTLNSVALIYQARCLSVQRLQRRLGTVPRTDYTDIIALLKNYMGLP